MVFWDLQLSSDLDTDEKQTCPMHRIFLGILLAINALAFLLIIFVTYKFFRTFGIKRKLQLLFILLVGFATSARIAFFITEIAFRTGQ